MLQRPRNTSTNFSDPPVSRAGVADDSASSVAVAGGVVAAFGVPCTGAAAVVVAIVAVLAASANLDARIAAFSLARVWPEFRRLCRLHIGLSDQKGIPLGAPTDSETPQAEEAGGPQGVEAHPSLFQWIFVPSTQAVRHRISAVLLLLQSHAAAAVLLMLVVATV